MRHSIEKLNNAVAARHVGHFCLNFNLRRATRLLTRHYDRVLQQFHLTSTQFSILASIIALQQVTTTELADIMNLERTSLTRNLRHVTKSQYIEQLKDNDKRKKIWQATEKGNSTFRQALPLWLQAQKEVTKNLDKHSLKQLRRNLFALQHLQLD